LGDGMDKKVILLELQKISLVKQLDLINELFPSPEDKMILAETLFYGHSAKFDPETKQYIIHIQLR